VGDDDGEAQDGVLAVGGVDGDEAVAEGLAGDDVFLEDVEVDEGAVVAVAVAVIVAAAAAAVVVPVSAVVAVVAVIVVARG
jgi:hypothetical protein